MSVLKAIQRVFSRKPKILIHCLEELEWFEDPKLLHKRRVSILSLGRGYSLRIEEDNSLYNNLRFIIWFKCRGFTVEDIPGIGLGFYGCRYKSEVVRYVNHVYNQIIINEL